MIGSHMARRPAMSPTAGGAKPDSAIGASAAASSGSRVRDMGGGSWFLVVLDHDDDLAGDLAGIALACTAGSSASGTRCATSTRSSPLSTSAVSCESCWASLRTKTPTARTSRASSLGVGIVGIVLTTTPPGLTRATSASSSSGAIPARLSSTSTGSATASRTAVVVWSMTSSAPAEETRSLLRGLAVAITYAPARLASCTA